MRVRLVWVERDIRGSDISTREEILHGEYAKRPRRDQAARLIARYHPELGSTRGVMLVDDPDEDHKWFVKANEVSSNRWVYVYADPA
jgi:hypothetical protein